MKTVLTIAAVLLAIAALLLIGVPCLFLWSVGKAGREEQALCDSQMEDDRSAAYYDDHDVSGLIEED